MEPKKIDSSLWPIDRDSIAAFQTRFVASTSTNTTIIFRLLQADFPSRFNNSSKVLLKHCSFNFILRDLISGERWNIPALLQLGLDGSIIPLTTTGVGAITAGVGQSNISFITISSLKDYYENDPYLDFSQLRSSINGLTFSINPTLNPNQVTPASFEFIADVFVSFLLKP